MATAPVAGADQNPVANPLRVSLQAVGSLWFAAVLLILMLVAMASATIFESGHGTPKALAMFYGARWFRGLLVLLAVNLLASLLARFPFPRRLTGFVVTHLSILVILAGAWLTDRYAVNGRAAIPEGETVETFTMADPCLIMADRRRGMRTTIDLDRAVFDGYRVRDGLHAPEGVLGDLRVAVQGYLPSSEWRWRVLDDNPSSQPAVEVAVNSAQEEDSAWLFDGDEMEVGSLSVVFQQAADEAELSRISTEIVAGSPSSPGAVHLFLLADGRLLVLFRPEQGELARTELAVGTPVDTPWAGRRFAVRQRLEHARVDWYAVPTTIDDESRVPAILLRLTAPSGARDVWVQKHRPQVVPLPNGLCELFFTNRTKPLGFALTLDRFRMQKYPGENRPRTFESFLTIHDPQSTDAIAAHLSMNRPVTHGGYTFYQSEYSVQRGATTSVLSVSRDAGRPVVFIGYVTLIIGMIVVAATRLAEQRRAERSPAAADAGGRP